MNNFNKYLCKCDKDYLFKLPKLYGAGHFHFSHNDIYYIGHIQGNVSSFLNKIMLSRVNIERIGFDLDSTSDEDFMEQVTKHIELHDKNASYSPTHSPIFLKEGNTDA